MCRPDSSKNRISGTKNSDSISQPIMHSNRHNCMKLYHFLRCALSGQITNLDDWPKRVLSPKLGFLGVGNNTIHTAGVNCTTWAEGKNYGIDQEMKVSPLRIIVGQQIWRVVKQWRSQMVSTQKVSFHKLDLSRIIYPGCFSSEWLANIPNWRQNIEMFGNSFKTRFSYGRPCQDHNSNSSEQGRQDNGCMKSIFFRSHKDINFM